MKVRFQPPAGDSLKKAELRMRNQKIIKLLLS
jgi:hypothetical protein